MPPIIPPLVTLAHVASESWEVGSEPRGFLPASAIGLSPDTPDYATALGIVLANVTDRLDEAGIDNATSTDPSHRKLARLLVRYYGAEMAITRSWTGSFEDLEGNAATIRSSDLSHWLKLLENAQDQLDELLEEQFPALAGGVWFAELFERNDPETRYREAALEGAPYTDRYR